MSTEYRYKPDYALIMSKSGKEVVRIVKHLIRSEKLNLDGVSYYSQSDRFLVALVTADRLIMVSHRKGHKSANVKEFPRADWDGNFDKYKAAI